MFGMSSSSSSITSPLGKRARSSSAGRDDPIDVMAAMAGNPKPAPVPKTGPWTVDDLAKFTPLEVGASMPCPDI